MRQILSELSSIATALEELTARITALADRAATGDAAGAAPGASEAPGAGGGAGRGDRELAADLYAVERSLEGARRRLLRAVDKSGR